MPLIATGGGGAAILAVNGLGGVGKSALAVHVAHGLVADYPAGQWLLDLAGTTDKPATPAEIMSRAIRFFDPMAQLPDDEAALGGIYRGLLAERKTLLILDNARDAAQVAPLLPPPPSAALITSRSPIHLPNVESRPLDVLEANKAQALLSEIAGPGRASSDELTRIAQACGCLPLALRVAGTFLALHETWTVAEYLEQLEDQRGRLKALAIADHDLDVAATLGLSVARLAETDPALALNWRKLSVFAGDFDRAAATAMWDCTDAEARDGLDGLLRWAMTRYDAERGRHWLHDLMRDVARLEAGGKTEQALAEAAACHAVHYRTVLEAANERYREGNEGVLAGLELFDRERANIETGHDWAVDHWNSFDDAARLSHGYANAGAYVLDLRLHPKERMAWWTVAADAARKIGDRRGEGNALFNWAGELMKLGETAEALQRAQAALEIYMEIESPDAETVRAALAAWRG